ncbi:restriction endonuclease subunit S [Campylobacter upsaliensis]
MQWSKEVQVDEWVREKLKSMGLKLGKDFLEKDASAYLKDALKGASKTKKQSGTGIPDFVCECYDLPVVIECKLGLLMLENKENHKISLSQTSIQNYAINGALHYAKHLIKSKKYKEVIAIGVAGDSEQKVAVKILYIYDENTYIQAKKGDFLFLENKDSFAEFYEDIILNDEQKHKFLLEKRTLITKHAKNLNKLMNDNSISTHERALYVAACLLSQQDIKNKAGNVLKKGLIPDDLTSQDDENYRDSVKIKNHIDEFLRQRDLDQEKVKLMINAFTRISINALRDKKKQKHKLVEKLLKEESSVNKQIFTYIYENIYKEINILNKNSKFYDVMGELYNEFLKYAMTDGKMGIVLTPSYVTKMMVQILEINADSKVMDLATGSAGFLIAAMDLMIDFARNAPNQNAKSKNEKIATIKQSQLLGVEENTDMFALATTNMILRGDGSSKIIQNDSFQVALELKEFKADRILLNPPFSYKENGMPFIKQGLDNMPRHALGAIIIQDSAGSGKAKETNQDILAHHTLKASIKMPMDLFVPMAGVQTSIYIFEAKVPHDFEKPVKFIDFRNDGYKRTEKALQEVDNPIQRYIDILKIYKQGLNAKIDNSVYEKPINLSEVYVEDFISESGADWNFDQHKKIDTTPTLADFKKCVSEYLAWEVSNVLKNQNSTQGGLEGNALSPRLVKLEKDFKQNGGEWREFKITQLFDYERGTRLTKGHRIAGNIPLLTAGEFNQGVKEFISNEEQKIFSNAITIDMFCNSFVHIKPFCCDDNILVLTAKKQMNQYHLRFISTIIGKDKPKYGYGKQYRIGSLEKHYIPLPVLPIPSLRGSETSEAIHKTQQESKMDCHEVANATSRNDESGYEIAFNYMESYIKELEAERLEELEAYLKVTGLNDYTLSQKEKEALKAFENLSTPNERERVSGISHEMPLKALQDSTLTDSREWQSFANTALSTLTQKELESSSAKNDIEWKSFKIGELFENIQQGARLKKEDHIQGDLPFVMAGITNNGICGFIGNDNARKFKANAITIDILGNVFYRDYDFGASDDVGVFWNEHKLFNKEIMLFICASIQKSLMGRFDFGNKLRASRAFDLPCLLPILDSNNIDFTFMESFIKAIEKQHIETLYRFWESKLKAYNAVINGGGGVSFTLSEYEEFCKGLKAQDFQFELYRNKISQSLKWKSFKCEKLFSVKSNPQLNKDSFSFGENAPYPYFTRTCLNNGIAGYVEYLDEDHKIKGESIAVGMLGMQFFYMQKDFYAGQFTKTLYPKFSGLNTTIAQFFIAWLNKHQRIFQGVLVRDFEKTFNETEILLPVLDSHNIDFDFIESFIKAIQKECIKSVVLWQKREAEAYRACVKED